MHNLEIYQLTYVHAVLNIASQVLEKYYIHISVVYSLYFNDSDPPCIICNANLRT